MLFWRSIPHDPTASEAAKEIPVGANRRRAGRRTGGDGRTTTVPELSAEDELPTVWRLMIPSRDVDRNTDSV